MLYKLESIYNIDEYVVVENITSLRKIKKVEQEVQYDEARMAFYKALGLPLDTWYEYRVVLGHDYHHHCISKKDYMELKKILSKNLRKCNNG